MEEGRWTYGNATIRSRTVGERCRGERWSVGHRIRDVEQGPDGALWMIEDSQTGGLFKVTPK